MQFLQSKAERRPFESSGSDAKNTALRHLKPSGDGTPNSRLSSSSGGPSVGDASRNLSTFAPSNLNSSAPTKYSEEGAKPRASGLKK
jgi:hypothetical protein